MRNSEADHQANSSHPISGVMSRVAVMASLHFDFRLALRCLSDIEMDNRGKVSSSFAK
jgi:hypothetical protein